MKRNVSWLLSTLSVVVLLFGYHTSTSGPTSTAGTAVYSGTIAGTSTAATTSSGSGGSGSGSGSGSGTGSSGSVGTSTTTTGDVVQTRWGPVQVELTVAGDAITAVRVLQYPTGDSRDEEINSYALPILIQETLDGQSGAIDMVSGATVTSAGYQQSLQSALDQAGL